MMDKTLGQIACEAISGHDGWASCAHIPELRAMWETAAQAVAAAEREACAALLDAEHERRKHLDNHAAYYARMIRERPTSEG